MSNRWFGRTAGRMPPAAAAAAPGRGAPHRDGGDAARRDAIRADAIRADGTVDAAPAPAPLLTIDALGRKCPIPIIMLAERINEVPVGAIVAVLADDPAAESDVPAWCVMKSHDHVLTEPLDRGWAILIRRGY